MSQRKFLSLLCIVRCLLGTANLVFAISPPCKTSSTINSPPIFRSLIQCGRKAEYCPLAASRNITSYGPESSGKISAASPSNIFILSSRPILLMFFLASFSITSNLSIVVTVPPSSRYLVIRPDEKPTAVPISKIFFGFLSVSRTLRSLAVSCGIIGTSAALDSFSISPSTPS